MFSRHERRGALKSDRDASRPFLPAAPARFGARTTSKPLSALAILAITALPLSACVSSTGNQLYGYTPPEPVPAEEVLAATDQQAGDSTDTSDDPAGQEQATAGSDVAEGSETGETVTALAPAQSGQSSVDALNVGITQTKNANPGGNLFAVNQTDAGSPPAVPVPGASPNRQSAANAPQTPPASKATEVAALSAGDSDTSGAEQVNAAEPVRAVALAEPPKKKSFFGRIFSSSTTPKKNVPTKVKSPRTNSLRNDIRVSRASARGNAGLPGVRLSSLFEMKIGDEKAGKNGGGVEMASAAGLARLAPRGLHIQTERVDVACLKPRLVQMIKKIERHYGRPAVITSGYRSPKRNRKIGGARNSRHTSCEAADIQVKGVSKWKLAAYVRSMPGRGGVGTYCHTKSVHVDIGTERDWNWRCRRRKK